jgi:hypothetical protein
VYHLSAGQSVYGLFSGRQGRGAYQKSSPLVNRQSGDGLQRLFSIGSRVFSQNFQTRRIGLVFLEVEFEAGQQRPGLSSISPFFGQNKTYFFRALLLLCQNKRDSEKQ